MVSPVPHVELASPYELEVLRSDKLPSGYHGVFARAGRGKPWVAKPFKRVRVGAFRTAREAASAVAAHWRELYGAAWPEVFRARLARAWCVYLDRRGGAVVGPDGAKRAAATGYRLAVWEAGRRRFVPPPDARADLFGTRAEAVAYFREWCRGRYEVLGRDCSWCFLWRSPPGTEVARVRNFRT